MLQIQEHEPFRNQNFWMKERVTFEEQASGGGLGEDSVDLEEFFAKNYMGKTGILM